MHPRSLPHFFNPALLSVCLPQPGHVISLVCLLDPLNWERELAELLALAHSAPPFAQAWRWKILSLPQSREVFDAICARLAVAPQPLPSLELHVLPLRQWPGFLQTVQGCLCLTHAPELRLQQTVMALAMDLPLWGAAQRPVAESPLWAELPVTALPAQLEDWQAMVPTLAQVPAGQSRGLRQALLKALGIQHTLSQTALMATDMAIIVYWGRSGSVFLQSLLDRHPQILSTPATVLMRFYEFWTEFLRALVEKNYPFDLNDFLNMFCLYFSSLFYAQPDSSTCCLDQLGPEQNTVLQVDVGAFKESFVWLIQTFFSGSEINSKIFFIALHYAYEMAQGLDISDKHLIAYQLHRPSLNPSTTGLFQDFPQARVLGMAREPMRALFSHLRMCRDDRRVGHQAEKQPHYDYPDMVLDGAFASYYEHQLVGWKELQAHYQPALYEMTLEKLHSSPESEMRKLAQWLKIIWHPCLLESSFNGLAYWGDRRAHQKIQGFSASHPLSADWQSCFSALDKQVLYALLDHDLHRQGYPQAFGWVKFLLPWLIYLPTRLEWQALRKALREGRPNVCQSWLRELRVRRQVCFDGLKYREI
ncbi:MAG: sulfotransferase [Candidatus Sericytochromatia bacterium]